MLAVEKTKELYSGRQWHSVHDKESAACTVFEASSSFTPPPLHLPTEQANHPLMWIKVCNLC